MTVVVTVPIPVSPMAVIAIIPPFAMLVMWMVRPRVYRRSDWVKTADETRERQNTEAASASSTGPAMAAEAIEGEHHRSGEGRTSCNKP